jgi:WD40 repeat protein
MFSFCRERESGLECNKFRKDLVTRLCERDLVLASDQPDCTVLGAIQSLRVEKTEDRYILLGCADGQVAIYDQGSFVSAEGKRPLALVARGNGVAMHSKGVCVADWYVNDTGMFNVGSFDGSVGVWDTNAMECAHLYRVSDCVNVIASGVFAESSSLIAVGTKSDQLRLIDVRQESNTHTLVGHTEQVVSLAWSNLTPNTLVSGDVEGTVFVWDLRKPVPVARLGSKTPPQVEEKERERKNTTIIDFGKESFVNFFICL